MGIKNLTIALFASCVACFCGDPDDDVVCTEEFVYGLNVQVKDSETNVLLTNGVTIIAEDGAYSETLMLMEETQTFVGAGERDGNYILHITAPQYQSLISETIMLGHDGCHVIPQSLEFLLETEE